MHTHTQNIQFKKSSNDDLMVNYVMKGNKKKTREMVQMNKNYVYKNKKAFNLIF